MLFLETEKTRIRLEYPLRILAFVKRGDIGDHPGLLNLARREADVVFCIAPFSEPDIVQRRLMTIPDGLYGGRCWISPRRYCRSEDGMHLRVN